VRRRAGSRPGRRGSSISDYRDGNGRPGYFQLRLCVYDRAGQSCGAVTPWCGAACTRAAAASTVHAASAEARAPRPTAGPAASVRGPGRRRAGSANDEDRAVHVPDNPLRRAPINRCLMPVRPCVAMTMRSTSRSLATRMISSAGSPCVTTVACGTSTSGPSCGARAAAPRGCPARFVRATPGSGPRPDNSAHRADWGHDRLDDVAHENFGSMVRGESEGMRDAWSPAVEKSVVTRMRLSALASPLPPSHSPARGAPVRPAALLLLLHCPGRST